MAVLIQAGRQFSYDVATLMAKGEGAMEASMVKAYVCRAAEWVTREAHADPRRHGLRRGVHRSAACFVDARVLSIFEGADETLCLKVIARPPRRRLITREGRQARRSISSSSELMRSKSAPDVVVVRIDEHGGQSGRSRVADVHLHRVAHVEDARAVELGEVRQGVVEDPRIGFGHAHHVAVDDAAHRHQVTLAGLAHGRRAAAPSRSDRSRCSTTPMGTSAAA